MSSEDGGMAPAADLPPFDPYSTPEARSIVAICSVFSLIACLAVAARFWSRGLKRTPVAADDWLIVAGLVFYLASTTCNILQVSMGALGHHIGDVTEPARLVMGAKIGTYSQYAYALAMGLVRASICMLLYRIFITKPFRLAILGVNIINGLWIVFNTLIVSFRCIPFRANWDFTLQDACLDQVPIVLGVAIWGLIVEVVIWALPIPMAWSLQLHLRHKIALTVIFGLGIFTIAVGIARVVTILRVTPEDPTWTQVTALQWISVEPSIAIVVTCMPVCRPLLEKLMPATLRKSLAGGSSGSRSGTRSRQVRSEPVKTGNDDEIMLVVRPKNSDSLVDEDLEGGLGPKRGSPRAVSTNDKGGYSRGSIHVKKEFSVSEGGN